jgi:hypothetical protein
LEQAVEQKICTVCKTTKAIAEFYRKGEKFESSCKPCKRAKKRAAYRFSWGVAERERFCKVAEAILDFSIENLKAANTEFAQVIERCKAKKEVSEWQAS